MAINDQNVTDAQMRSISAKTMIIAGDTDAVKPERALAMFTLRGGGDEEAAASGALQRVPAARLVILPATSHIGILGQSAVLAPMVNAFLDDVLPTTPNLFQAQLARGKPGRPHCSDLAISVGISRTPNIVPTAPPEADCSHPKHPHMPRSGRLRNGTGCGAARPVSPMCGCPANAGVSPAAAGSWVRARGQSALDLFSPSRSAAPAEFRGWCAADRRRTTR
ncbi:alpha/beta fold hydrolase [Nocardia jiangxiensis]|uniref:Alpha/beta fold hydrolase n=1 Tax=Nocardia jiangxiensis TaxID=282685 RepID=A0ABW6SBZ1_9NOCA